MTEMDKQAFIAHIEALLKEQIKEMGEDPEKIQPHEYAAQMRCEVQDDGAMIYLWREMPILRMVPEKQEDGKIYWRMFTPDERGLEALH